jgi:hypothetical protein
MTEKYHVFANEQFQPRLGELMRDLHKHAPSAYKEIRAAYDSMLKTLQNQPHVGTGIRVFDSRGAIDFEDIHLARKQRTLHIRVRVSDKEKTVELVWAWMDYMDKFKGFKLIW